MVLPMLQGHSLDWPLSREEKKYRLLCLYDKDLKDTDELLQLSERRHSFPSGDKGNIPHCTDVYPGSHESFTAGLAPLETSAVAEQASCNAPFSALRETPPEDQDLGRTELIAPEISQEITASGGDGQPSVDPYASPCKSQNLEDPLSTQRDPPSTHRSIRSSVTEYFTPDGTPRTPLAGSPALALRGHLATHSRSTGDSSVCLQMQFSARRSASKGQLPPRPARGPGKSFSTTTLPSRPSSAAMASAFSAFRSSRDVQQRYSQSPTTEEWYPPQVLSAARHGRSAQVEAALLSGFSPNYTDPYGNTLFHIACQNGNKRVAKLVVKYGCGMNAQNFKGNTGLHFLFAYGYCDIAEYFISKGADQHVKNTFGNTARQGIR